MLKTESERGGGRARRRRRKKHRKRFSSVGVWTPTHKTLSYKSSNLRLSTNKVTSKGVPAKTWVTASTLDTGGKIFMHTCLCVSPGYCKCNNQLLFSSVFGLNQDGLRMFGGCKGISGLIYHCGIHERIFTSFSQWWGTSGDKRVASSHQGSLWHRWN